MRRLLTSGPTGYAKELAGRAGDQQAPEVTRVGSDGVEPVELSEEALRLGLALAMQETVAMARPARLELTAFRSAT